MDLAGDGADQGEVCKGRGGRLGPEGELTDRSSQSGAESGQDEAGHLEERDDGWVLLSQDKSYHHTGQ